MMNELQTLPRKVNSKWEISSKSLGFIHSHKLYIGKPDTSVVVNDCLSHLIHINNFHINQGLVHDR